MPRLITQTNMDIHSVRVLREEISRFALWLARHTNQYFLNEYEAADKEYVDEVRSGKV